MSSKTGRIGEVSEAAVLTAFLKHDKVVLLPFGNGQRYDLVLDEGAAGFVRVQVKTGKLDAQGETLSFSVRSIQVHTGGKGTARAYHGEADLFAVYCPQNGRVYVLPVSEAGTGTVTLRLSPPRNNQTSGVRWAKDYEL